MSCVVWRRRSEWADSQVGLLGWGWRGLIPLSKAVGQLELRQRTFLRWCLIEESAIADKFWRGLESLFQCLPPAAHPAKSLNLNCIPVSGPTKPTASDKNYSPCHKDVPTYETLTPTALSAYLSKVPIAR